MYSLVTIKDVVCVPPRRFGDDLEKVIISELEDILAGRVNRDIGIILTVTDVKEIGEGRIVMGDASVHYDTTFEILAYQPQLQEVVEGMVTEITEFGAFICFGPIDGLIHVSQVTEDYMNYDQKNSILTGRESHKLLKQGDLVRARIIAMSLKDTLSNSKIGLTMRQPYLGKLEWLDEEKEKKETDVEKEGNAEGNKKDQKIKKNKKSKKGDE